MIIGQTLYSEEYGKLTVAKKAYSAVKNAVVWYGVDEKGREHVLDGTETENAPAKEAKVSDMDKIVKAIRVKKGEKGDKGDKGDIGFRGEKGEKGDKGDKGDKGEPGNDGEDGKDGKDGKQGIQGVKGEAGKDGKDGKNGKKGDKGEPGLNGLSGGGGIHEIKHATDVDYSPRTATNGQALVWNSETKKWEPGTVAGGSGSGIVETIVAGNNIDVDATDPANPIVSVETLTLADISDVTASVTELNYVDGVTSAIQTQIDGKQPLDSDLTAIAGLSPSNDDILQRKAGAWTNRTMAQVKTDLVLVKGDVGLGNVDNTSDVNKPVSTAQQTALDAKLDDSQLDTDVTLAANSDAKIATQKATKSYVDAVAQGLSVKGSVLLATAAALPANTYLAGVITITATGTLTVDGTVTALNDRILVKDEVAQLGNGIYKVTTAGAIGVAAVLTRSTDMDIAAEFPGAFCFVESGTVNTAAGFVCTNSTPPTVGTTAITFTQFSGAGEITAGAALTKTANTLDVAVDNSSIEVSGDALRVKASGVTNTMLAGSIAASKLVGSDIATVGTITSGTWNGTDIAVADGGTGRSTSTTAYGLIAAGTTATGAHQTLAAGATTEILVGGGASALPVWTTAQGSGAPVRATSPTLTTPNIGTPSAGVLTNCTGLPAASVVPGTLAAGTYLLAENASIGLDPAGSADGKYSGITVTGTGGATIAFGDLVTLDKDDSRWELVDISVAAAATGDARGIIGIAVTSSTDGGAITVLLNGIIRADANFPALTIGAPVYASTTGDVVVTQPTTTDHVIRIVGYGLTADEMYFNPSNDYITHT